VVACALTEHKSTKASSRVMLERDWHVQIEGIGDFQASQYIYQPTDAVPGDHRLGSRRISNVVCSAPLAHPSCKRVLHCNCEVSHSQFNPSLCRTCTPFLLGLVHDFLYAFLVVYARIVPSLNSLTTTCLDGRASDIPASTFSPTSRPAEDETPRPTSTSHRAFLVF
jgi:hypothetical protein